MSILSKIIKSPDLMSAVDKAMKKVTDEVVKRDKAGGPISGREIGSDHGGTDG